MIFSSQYLFKLIVLFHTSCKTQTKAFDWLASDSKYRSSCMYIHLKLWIFSVLQIRDVYPRYRIRIVPSRPRVKNIPDPGSGSASKNLGIFTQKIVSKLSDPDLDFLPILDRGVKGQKGTGSRIRIRNTEYFFFITERSRCCSGG